MTDSDATKDVKAAPGGEPDASVDGLFDSDAWFHCPSCNATLLLPGEVGFASYFEDSTGDHCPKCSTKIQLWSVLFDAVRDNFMLTGAFKALGASEKHFPFYLKTGETKELVFSDLGIPDDAHVLSINYTPYGEGHCFPVELHGNTPHRGLPKGRVFVFGTGRKQGETQPRKIFCSITWLRPVDADDGWSHLLDAYRAYADNDWRGVVIPANIAAEAALSKAMHDAFVSVRVASEERIEEFLSRGATYSHQLNIVIPFVAKLLDIPRLPADIRGRLNRLRDLRNKVAHTGALPKPLTKNDAAELVVAATFGFHYGRFFRQKLTSKPSPA